jgi:hypothetical protein
LYLFDPLQQDSLRGTRTFGAALTGNVVVALVYFNPASQEKLLTAVHILSCSLQNMAIPSRLPGARFTALIWGI